MGQRPPQPLEQIEVYADGAFCIRFNQNNENPLDRTFTIFGTAYHVIRSLYPDFGLNVEARATLDLNLHAGRTQYEPILVGGQWSAEIDAAQPFEVAFADLTLLLLRDANINWSRDQVERRLREVADRNLP